jgi:hypothetical protein
MNVTQPPKNPKKKFCEKSSPVSFSKVLKIIALALIAVGIALFGISVFLAIVSIFYYVSTALQLWLIPLFIAVGGCLIFIGFVTLLASKT